jgi:BolA protein
MTSLSRAERIHQKLKNTLQPTFLEVTDDSHKHIDHEAAKTGGGHFIVTISSPLFIEKSLVNCHRMVYAETAEFGEEIHALRILIKRSD